MLKYRHNEVSFFLIKCINNFSCKGEKIEFWSNEKKSNTEQQKLNYLPALCGETQTDKMSMAWW